MENKIDFKIFKRFSEKKLSWKKTTALPGRERPKQGVKIINPLQVPLALPKKKV